MTLARASLILQLGTTLPLVGLIWFVQVVAYPQFARVGAAEFPAYHEAHARLITFIVGPLMLGELVGSVAGAFSVDPAMTRRTAFIGAGLALATWMWTFFVSVPLHEILAHGFDARAQERLVTTNWFRTLAWTLRGALLLRAVASFEGAAGR